MEFEGNYNPLGMQIEGHLRKKYEDAFESLKQAYSYKEDLEFIANMFEVLGKSRPDKQRGVDWAKDVIEAYRTVGKMFIEAYTKYTKPQENSEIEDIEEIKEEELQKKVEDFENTFG